MAIKPLREELGRIDQEILKLVARRQELVLEIGEAKAQEGLAIRDFGQEKVVVERVVKTAMGLGLSPDLARNLALMLIDASLTAQEKSRVTHQGKGSGRRALVIGGAGKMGQWMARFLSSQNYEVEIADPAGPVEGFSHQSRWQETTLDHDMVVVAAPLRASRKILEEMLEAKPKGLVFDIGSLKSPLRDPLQALARAGIKVASVHPMFGPDTDLLSGRHVIFVDLGVPQATREARALFDSTMAVQVEMPLEMHDKVIAYVLGVSHAINIAFFTTLTGSGEAAAQLAEVSSTTFDAQLGIASGVTQDNPHLYFEIQSLNDYGSDALDALVASAKTVRQVIRDGDEEAFVDMMNRGRRYIEGHRISRSRE